MPKTVTPLVLFCASFSLIVLLVCLVSFTNPDPDTRGLLLNVISSLAGATLGIGGAASVIGSKLEATHTETQAQIGEVRKDVNGRLDARIRAAATSAVLAHAAESGAVPGLPVTGDSAP